MLQSPPVFGFRNDRLLEHIIDARFGILNPVQWSAANMDRRELKDRFGDRLTFWGGGANSQQTLYEVVRQWRDKPDNGR